MKKTMHDYMLDVPVIGNRLLKEYKNLCKKFVELLKGKEYRQYVLVASGSSSNIANAVKYFIQKVMKIPVRVVTPATFLHYEIEAVEKDTLVVFMSQSGYSTNTNAAAEILKSKGNDIIGFCNYLDSPMAKVIKNTFAYGNDPGDYFVAKGFSISSLSIMLHFLELAIAKEIISKKQYDDYIHQFHNAINGYGEMTKQAEMFYENNKEFCRDINRTIFTGYGPGLALAQEGTLKFLETFGASPIAFELEEFLHGPDYSVNKDTTIFMIIPHKSKMCERAKEVYGKIPILTDRTIIITNDASISGKYVISTNIEELSEEVAILMLVAPMQYIADKICLDLRIGTETLAVKKFCDSIAFKAPGSEGKF